MRSLGLFASVALGAEEEIIEQEARRMAEAFTTYSSAVVPAGIAWLLTHGMLGHLYSWGARIADFATPLSTLPQAATRALIIGDEDALRRSADASPSMYSDQSIVEQLRLLIRAATGAETSGDECASALQDIAASRLLLLDDAETYAVALDLFRRLRHRAEGPAHDTMTQAARTLLLQLLDWCDQHGLGPWSNGMREAHGTLLSAVERKHCAQKARKHTAEGRRLLRLDPPAETRVSLTMIGRITLRLPDQHEGRPIKGANVRALLGLMVAEQLLKHPFDRAEFRRLAAPDVKNDKERGLYVRQLVYRLREMLGHEAINTSGDHPVLDASYVACDLVEAHRALEESRTLGRAGRIVPAGRLLNEALTIVTDVPFPGLYAPIFESARDEIEASLRTATLRLGARMIEEGEINAAVELLRAAMISTSNDPEVGELLRSALAIRGEMIDAERVRMTMQMM